MSNAEDKALAYVATVDTARGVILALVSAKTAFTSYAQHHQANGNSDEAIANYKRAHMCHHALALMSRIVSRLSAIDGIEPMAADDALMNVVHTDTDPATV